MGFTDIANWESGIPTEVLRPSSQQELAAKVMVLAADLRENSQTV